MIARESRPAQPLTEGQLREMAAAAPQREWFRALNRRAGSDPVRLTAAALILDRLLKMRNGTPARPSNATNGAALS
jgi:hypothetical protein